MNNSAKLLKIKKKFSFLNNKYSIPLKDTIDIFKKSFLFIIFSLLNFTLPILITMMVSQVNKYGAYAAISIGYVTSFQLAFGQIGFVFAIFSSFIYYKKFKDNVSQRKSCLNETYFIAFIYGIITTPIYILTTYYYTKYANAHFNTIDSLGYGYEFIFSSAGFVFLITICSCLIMTIHAKYKQTWSIFFTILLFAMILIFALALGYYSPLKVMGIGLGMTIGTIFALIILLIFCFMKKIISLKARSFSIKWLNIKLILKNVWRQVTIIISIQIFKTIALVFLNITVPNELTNSIPLNVQMARMIWYNILYFIPFFTLGMGYAIYYYYLENPQKKSSQERNTIITLSVFICFVFSLLITIVAVYITEPLSWLYSLKQDHSYSNQTISNNLDKISKNLIITQLINNNFIPQNIKNDIVGAINGFPKISDVIFDIIVQKYLLIQYIHFNYVDINNLINLPSSFTLLYISIYCILYPLGQLLESFTYSFKKKQPKAILLVIIQAFSIFFIVWFGITFQESNRFFALEAWSFPLAVIGAISFIYFISTFFIEMGEFKLVKIIKKNTM